MVFNTFCRSTALLCSFFLFSFTNSFAQKAGLEVTRCSGVDRNAPVHNVTLDGTGKKWISNSKGVFQVKAADFATQRVVPAGEKSVLACRGGNADITWSEDAFRKIVKTPCTVISAWYDAKTTQLWLGTDEAGVYQFKTTPQLELVEKYTTSNSKIKSNNVSNIFQDKSGRFWIGTDKGLFYGTPGRWKTDFNEYVVQRVREFGSDIYVLADGEISKGAGGEKWVDMALDTKKIESQITDFDVDATGKMWIVSGILTRFDLLDNAYETFSGPEYYTSEYGSSIAIDFDGAVWVGTDDKGLYSVDKASAMTLNGYVEQPISCTGPGKDAILRVKVTGGVPPYTFKWTGGLVGDNPKNVGVGNYDVTVTDSKGKVRTTQVNVPDARLVITVKQKKAASAPGKNDASAVVDIAGNASGLIVQWDNGESLVEAKTLTAGTHSVTVTDPKGCTAVGTVVISGKALPMELGITETTPIKCAGEPSAALTTKIYGGTPPFKYQWTNPALTGEAPSKVPAGTYTLVVTDAAGLSKSADITVKQPDALSLTAQAQGPASIGNADGKAIAQAKGGSGAYLFKWESGESIFSAVKLKAGVNKVTVTDANGCKAEASVTITENIQALSVAITEKAGIKCAGEKSAVVAAQVTGGKGPFTYQWSDPAFTGETANNIAAGTYQLTLTDATGKTSTANVTVKQPEPLTLTVQAQAPATTGNTDGKAIAQPVGGVGPYLFQWESGESSNTAGKLKPGKNNVTVADANGCKAEASVVISENILPLTVSIAEKNPIKCAGEKSASLTTQVAGGKGPFRYVWSNPTLSGDNPGNIAAGDYQLTLTDATGATSTATVNIKQPEMLTVSAQVEAPASTGNGDGKAIAQPKGGTGTYAFKWDNGETAANAVKLAPGSHKVTVSDANGCKAETSVTVTENILPLTVSVAEKNSIKCAGEKSASLTTQVNGGKGPFRYNWSNSALSGDAPTNVAAGDYKLTLTDATGATSIATVNIKQPEILAVSAQVQASASTGNGDGKAIAQPKGGTGTYAFKWDNGETAASAVKLAPGAHSVTVSDANGCKAETSVTITENILPLTVSVAEKNTIKCAGEKSATLATQVNGGKGPFRYTWSNPALSGEAPANVAAGDYQLTLTDATGATSTATVQVKQPEILTVAAQVQSSASTGNSDGKALAQPKGGAGSYTYAWDNGETTPAATKLPPGTHGVTVSDANGCKSEASVTITENILPLLIVVSEKSAIKCAGDKAALAIKTTGGKPPYAFIWSNPAASGDQPAGLPAGDYAVTVTDAAGSSQTAAIAVHPVEPLLLELLRDIGATNERSNDGKAQVAIKGGTPKYSVVWDTKQTGAIATKLPLGLHSVTVTDANGCTQKLDFETTKRILPELTGVIEDGQTIRMKLLNFDTDSDVPKAESLPMLDELYDFMTENPAVVIEIAGHTNNQPSDDFADKLSTSRAKAVADYLFAKGVDQARVVYKGYGKRQPIAPNTSPEGRKTNQRVEIKILKGK